MIEIHHTFVYKHNNDLNYVTQQNTLNSPPEPFNKTKRNVYSINANRMWMNQHHLKVWRFQLNDWRFCFVRAIYLGWNMCYEANSQPSKREMLNNYNLYNVVSSTIVEYRFSEIAICLKSIHFFFIFFFIFKIKTTTISVSQIQWNRELFSHFLLQKSTIIRDLSSNKN